MDLLRRRRGSLDDLHRLVQAGVLLDRLLVAEEGRRLARRELATLRADPAAAPHQVRQAVRILRRWCLRRRRALARAMLWKEGHREPT